MTSRATGGTSEANGEAEGCFTGFADGQVLGWAWDPRRPDVPLTVDLFADGVPLGSVVANQFDPRLPDIGRHSFRATCINIDKVRPPFRLRGIIRDPRTELSSAMIIGTQEELERWLIPIQGTVLPPRAGLVSGWVVRRSAPNEVLEVEALLDHVPFATVRADQAEPIGAQGPGNGFTVPLPLSILDGSVHTVSFRVKGEATEIEGSPVRCGFFAATAVQERLQLVESRLHRIEQQAMEAERRLDAKLAAFARLLMSRHDALAAVQRDGIDYELNELRRRLGLGERSTRDPAKPVRSAGSVSADLFEGFGWHDLERQGDLIWRWMPKTASVILDVAAETDAELVIRGPFMLDPEHGRGLSVLVNGVKVFGAVTDDDDAGSGWRFVGLVPAVAFSFESFAIVTIRTAFDRAPLDDARRLAVAVSYLSIAQLPVQDRDDFDSSVSGHDKRVDPHG